MEVRKVQQTGKSSYIVTLPKEWVLSHGIKKNDSVGLEITPDGNLLIIPKIEKRKVKRSKVIRVVETTNPTLLFRLLVSAYIMGHSEIKVEGSLTTEHKKFVRKFVKMAIGEEIIEEGENYVVIKDLLDPHEMPFNKSIKRMFVILQNMIKDSVRSIELKNEELARDVIARDDEIDRLHWLIGRQYSMMIRNFSTAKILGVTLWEGVNYFLVSKYLERIGDHAARIAQYGLEIIGVDGKILNKIESGTEISLQMLFSSVSSFLNGDIKLANQTINGISSLTTMCEDIHKTALKYTGKVAISIGYIAESIRRIGEYSADISERALNMWVEK